ncbi:MAG: DNA polymerase III subunit delta' [Phenylobacterium sp.]|uniref:DNA polymerase III subunit delta' n=1 Tax=Phenylobacterium sp. TaxID=1871053 RepID=UPI001B7907EE|nr:DNA polymerase III subunit delta' [Phenylobacterium sp.]MBP7650651.1 DNA polymerase III subunit delta' [Phenylobacterium sp.]MBP7818174.1 DNA polymerase III subunit delta' [Phenylobacterium sp.]MBP9231107.1 DNA polymerase III subunit delta' [Phenylobacterium sp.]MBP9755320.1 DNA polymerase III subunit delta' [Phenylobacterium sp.]
MVEVLPHPRDVFDLQGHEAAEQSFEASRARGRLHHAWLLTGPEGVGKATFAYRAARRLLGAPPAPEYGPLGVDPNHPVSRQIMARSHPDILVLERVGEDGKPRKVIPVDEARKLSEFFSKSPASAPHRVAIIDAADDLNANSANAVLKTLEEPPPSGVLLLVSHSPGRLLPTIRSRCRRLAFHGLSEAETAAFVQSRTGANAEDAIRLARMSVGAPGRAWALANAGAVAIDDAAKELLRDLPQLDEATALSLADKFRGGEGATQFNLLFERLAERVHARVLSQANDGFTGLDRWASAWETLQRLPREVEAVNLDRADALFTALSELRDAARA